MTIKCVWPANGLKIVSSNCTTKLTKTNQADKTKFLKRSAHYFSYEFQKKILKHTAHWRNRLNITEKPLMPQVTQHKHLTGQRELSRGSALSDSASSTCANLASRSHRWTPTPRAPHSRRMWVIVPIMSIRAESTRSRDAIMACAVEL